MALQQGEHSTLSTAEPYIEVFCQTLAATGIVGWACRQAGINRTTAYNWRKKWKSFADRWDQAKIEFGESLEGEAHWRAKNRDRPASASDAMLRFLLKANMPDKYGDKQQLEVSGKDGEPVSLVVNITRRESDE